MFKLKQLNITFSLPSSFNVQNFLQKIFSLVKYFFFFFICLSQTYISKPNILGTNFCVRKLISHFVHKNKTNESFFLLSHYLVLYVNMNHSIQFTHYYFVYVQKADKTSLDSKVDHSLFNTQINDIAKTFNVIADQMEENVSFYYSRYFDMHCKLLQHYIRLIPFQNGSKLIGRIRSRNCLPFESTRVHPRFFGEDCVAHLFSFQLTWPQAM